MKIRLTKIAPLLAFLVANPVAADTLRDQAKGLFSAIPLTPPALPGETMTPDKLALGKMLYFDPRLSENQDISCSSCHNLSMSGVDGRTSSVGHNGQLGGRKAQTVLNAVFNKSLYWDGRAPDLKGQVSMSVMVSPPP
jgi:cytochrome c peroxidase